MGLYSWLEDMIKIGDGWDELDAEYKSRKKIKQKKLEDLKHEKELKNEAWLKEREKILLDIKQKF